jgi:hypothetical protein
VRDGQGEVRGGAFTPAGAIDRVRDGQDEPPHGAFTPAGLTID